MEAAVSGVTREMMTIVRKSTEPYTYEISHSDIAQIANKVKEVPREFINTEGNNVTDECVKYILPLIEGETNPEFRLGLPVHIVL